MDDQWRLPALGVRRRTLSDRVPAGSYTAAFVPLPFAALFAMCAAQASAREHSDG